MIVFFKYALDGLPLSIERIDEVFIDLFTKGYSLPIDVFGGATKAWVEGLYDGFYHEWDAANDYLYIKNSSVERLVTGAEWTVYAEKGSEEEERSLIYNVVNVSPVITAPGDIFIVKGRDVNLSVSVANLPSTILAEGVLAGITFEGGADSDGNDQILLLGSVPNVTFGDTTFEVSFFAENDGGSDKELADCTILDTASQISNLAYAFATRTLSWTKAANAKSYAYKIGTDGEWVDVGDVASYTFSVADAPAVGSTIYMRVNQAWIGDEVSVSVGIAPTISFIANQSKVAGYSQFTVQASATGTSPITWSISGTGASISSSGLITINAGLSINTHSYTVTATNAAGSDTESFSVVVSGTAPTISSISNVSKTVGYSQFTVQASASGTTPITWSISGTGASISSSGLITITAGKSTGTYSYTVTATNVAGSDTESFSLVVSSTTAPTISSISNFSKAVGYSQFTVQASASGTTPITWSISGTGVSISSSGLITITAGKSTGTYSYTVTATNVAGSDTESFSLVVSVGIPGVPTGVSITYTDQGGFRHIYANWTAPSNNGGSNIVSYTLQYRADTNGTWSNWYTFSPNPINDDQILLNSNPPGTFRKAQIRVRAYNGTFYSAYATSPETDV